HGLCQVLANAIGAFKASEIGALAGRVAGDEEAHVRCLGWSRLCVADRRHDDSERTQRGSRDGVDPGHSRLLFKPLRIPAVTVARAAGSASTRFSPRSRTPAPGLADDL